MSDGAQVFARLQRAARDEATRRGRPPATGEYVTRHGLESFLARLTATPHAPNFVLKGGLLIAAYAARRPTRDIDSQVSGVTVDQDYLRRVIGDVVAVPASDGVQFDVGALRIETIRGEHEYPGMRARLPATLGWQRPVIVWDVSTGDPVVPEPQVIRVPRVLGDPIRVRGYAPEAVVAEKGVTILQRGTASTRWRDYVDIVQLDRSCELDRAALTASSRAVASARGVALEPIGTVIAGYGALSQRKWSAWRAKAGVHDLCEPDLDEQMRLVAQVLDPIFTDRPAHDEPGSRTTEEPEGRRKVETEVPEIAAAMSPAVLGPGTSTGAPARLHRGRWPEGSCPRLTSPPGGGCFAAPGPIVPACGGRRSCRVGAAGGGAAARRSTGVLH